MKLLLVCNPGGHLSTMWGLKKFWSSHDREWVTYHKFDTEKLQEQEIVHWVTEQEARMLGRAIINFFKALIILHRSKPDLIISTGASLAVPFIWAGKLYQIKTIYIESLSRSQEISFSGRLVYSVVDEFYVQWIDCLEQYPKAKYKGIVI